MGRPAKNFLSIKTWSAADQPRHKLTAHGSEGLSDSELLAILVGSGSREESAVDLCKRILHHVEGNLDRLARMTLKELMEFKGIGEAKAVTISAALELGRRRQALDIKKGVKIIDSNSAYALIAPWLADKNHEEFWVLYLNRSHVVTDRVRISTGGVAGTVVDPKIVFKGAIQHLASAIILAHNHPSGQLKPSKQDISLTTKLKEAGRLLEINVLDHLIVAQHGYLSMADEGLMAS